MDILFYLEILLFLQALAYCASIILDYYGKEKGFTLIKLSGFKKIIFLKSKFEDKKDFVSKISFQFQISNYIYLFAYLVFAIIESFVFPSPILSIVLVVLNLIGFCVLLLSIIIVGFLSFKNEAKNGKKH